MFGVHRSGNSAFIVTLSDLRQSFLLPTSLHDFYRYIRTEFYSSSYQRRPYGRVLFLMRGQELNVLVQKLSKAHSFIVPHQGSPARRQFLTSAIFQTTKSILNLLSSFNPATRPSLAPHMAQLQMMQADLPFTSV